MVPGKTTLRRLRRRLFPYTFPEPADAPLMEPLEFRPSEGVARALAALGRTEDLRFSPSKRLLAIPGFASHRLLLLEVDVFEEAGRLVVRSDDYMTVTSPGVGNAHGVDFIDERTLAVANRDALVSIIEVPPGPLGGRELDLEPSGIVRGSGRKRVDSPGSLAVLRGDDGEIDVLVCNNYVDRVSRHRLDPRGHFREVECSVLLNRGIWVPDGIACSSGRDWIAVSSHGTHDAKVFETARRWNRWRAPFGVLQDVNHSHGLRFTSDDRHIVVADSGAPFIHIFERGGSWHGKKKPARSIRVLDAETFQRGRKNPTEGGPKGIDLTADDRVVAVTCEEVTLRFFSLEEMLR